MNKKRLFFNFLQKPNALQAYKTNFKRYNHRSLILDEELVLNAAFVWIDTPEGHIYWSELHNKWEIYYKNYTRNHF